MKKLSLFVILVIFSLMLVACSETPSSNTESPSSNTESSSNNEAIVTLSAPTIGVVGEILTWDAVPNALEYVVVVNNLRRTVRTRSFDLSSLDLESGTYEVSVIAIRDTIQSRPSNRVNYTVENNTVVSLTGLESVHRYESDGLFRFFFNFLDSNQQRVSSNATIFIRIVNDNGTEVYNGVHRITEANYSDWSIIGFMGSTIIPFSQIAASNSTSGRLYYQINAQGSISSDELSLSISNLPFAFGNNSPNDVQISGDVLSWNAVTNAHEYVVVVNDIRRTVRTTSFNLLSLDLESGTYEVSVIAKWNNIESNPSSKLSYTVQRFNLQRPRTPIEVSRFFSTGTLWWKLNITDISYEYDNSRQRLTVSFAGQKTFDTNGNNYARTQSVSVRLIDSDGFVVESRSFSTPSIMVGEGFRNRTITFSNIPSGEYILEIIPNQN